MTILPVVFLIIGLLAGIIINSLADDLPVRERPRAPHCPRCGYHYRPLGWSAVLRLIQGGKCPDCGLPVRTRSIAVEIGTAVLLAILPLFIEPSLDLIVYAFYSCVLILVIVIDIEHRLILHVVTIPTTIFAVAVSPFLSDHNLLLAVVGAITAFLFFLAVFLLGQRMFGPGALGFGDVTLSMMMGAMLGFQRVFFALILGIFLAGFWSIVALVSGRMKMRSYFAYGPFLALAGIMMLIWGTAIKDWWAP